MKTAERNVVYFVFPLRYSTADTKTKSMKQIVYKDKGISCDYDDSDDDDDDDGDDSDIDYDDYG